MKFLIYGQARIVIRVVLVVCLSILLAVTLGCGSGGGGGNGSDDDGDSPETPETTDNSTFTTMMSAVSEGQLTLNNRWTQSDLDDQDINAEIKWEGKGTLKPAQMEQINSFTTFVYQYEQRRKQCEEDFEIIEEDGNRRCYPELTLDGVLDDTFRCASPLVEAEFFIMRYGYWCGAGRPDGPPFGLSMPEPLDAVDYCCRLHDGQAWADTGEWDFDGPGDNECGILMCLDQATGFPSNIMDLLPDVEESRQCWYDWAATVCGGNQFDNARAPILGP